MSEQPYVPTTNEVREAYVEGVHPEVTERYRAEFDRWLDQVKAEARREGQTEAWADAVASAYLHETEHFTSIKHDPNPYRNGEGQ